jgi:hypothetical protein
MLDRESIVSVSREADWRTSSGPGDISMRKRVVGAGLLVAIGIGIWLSSLFKGLGPGGSGTGFGLTDKQYTSVGSGQSDGSLPVSTSSTRDAAPESPDTRKRPTVLIDGHSYLLQLGTDAEEGFKPVELSEIVRLAQRAEPDANGIRVHIKRRANSRTSAEIDLVNALDEAGVQPQEIQQYGAFVE